MLSFATPSVGNGQDGISAFVVAAPNWRGHSYGVLGTDEIIARLRAKKIRNVDIARALELPDSRVPAILRKERRLTLEEGVKLVEAFALEEAPVSPLPPAILRLVALHIARSLGAEAKPEDARMQELLADLEAFSRFVADPQVRESIAAAEAFFRAMELRPRVGAKGTPETVR